MATGTHDSLVSDQKNWQAFRAEMPVVAKWSYLDHAAVAPLPRPAANWVQKWMQQSMADGDVVWPEWAKRLDAIRATAARLINAESDEIAFVANTTFGINLVAEGLDWQPGDNLVVPDHEFPSNLYPWLALEKRGVEVRVVPLDGMRICPQRMADACDGRTRLVTASWVGYASGYRINVPELAEVAHRNGALFFLDAIQGLGVFPLDVKDAQVDFLAADGHKWLMGPEGAGIFYINRQHLDRLRPLNVGWNSVKQGNDFSIVKLDIKESALRYEGGSPNMAGNFGMGGSLDLLESFGLASESSPIAERVLELSSATHERLSQLGAIVYSSADRQHGSGIVSFEIPGADSAEARLHLLERGVVTSFRGGRLRASLHCYNDESDIDRLCGAVEELPLA